MSASYNTITVTSAATLVLAPSAGRRGFIIKNNGGQTVYLGLDSSVLTTTGIPIQPQDDFRLTGEHDTFKGSVYGITSTGSSDCRYWDWTP